MNIETLQTKESVGRYNDSPVANKGNNKARESKPAEDSNEHPALLSESTLELLVDKTTGLVQSIIKDGVSNQVIRKMPSDEYLKLIQLMNGNTNNSLHDTA